MKKLLFILLILPVIGFSQTLTGTSVNFLLSKQYINTPLYKINGTSVDTSTSTIRWFTKYKYALLNSKKASNDSINNHGYATNYKLNQKVSSQWTTSSSNIYFNTGSVGIGYASPSYTLHVKGGIDADSIFIGGAKVYAGDPNRWADFNHNIYTDWGFVGINKNNPTHWLDVAGGIKGDSIFGTGLSFYDSTYTFNLKHNKANALLINGSVSEDYYVSFNTGTAGKTMLIDEGEIGIKVGIGLGNPTHKLDVNGGINADTILINNIPVVSSQWSDNGTNIYYNSGNVGIGTNTPFSALQVNGSVQVGNDSESASADKVGAIRYRVSGNSSICEMCMQTGASTYAWVVIKQNTW